MATTLENVCIGLEDLDPLAIDGDETTNVGEVSLLFNRFDRLLMLCIDILQEKNQRRPFYRPRSDILDLFDDEHCRKCFRFDKPSILYITGE